MALITPPPSGPVNLDSAPPHPQMPPADSGAPSPLLATPQAMAVRGLMMMEEGAKLVQSAIPGIDPMSVDIITLKQAIPQLLVRLSAPTGGATPSPLSGGMGMSPAPPMPMM